MKSNRQMNLIGEEVELPLKNKTLTWRQKQSLISIYWRIKNFGSVTFSDIVGDIGVAFVTMASHLDALKDKQLIQCNKKPINMTFSDELVLTQRGEEIAREFISTVELSPNDPLDKIFDKLKKDFERAAYSPSIGFNLNSKYTFSKSYNNLIKDKNMTEPVITSITLYSELDSQLNLLKEYDKIYNTKTYSSLTQNKLNIEIRSGRLSSIVIPVMLRGQMPQKELLSILETSWSWPNTVRNRQINRYMYEATSLGLIQQRGGLVTSLKPSATDAVSWIATKTGDTFLNTMNIAPKAALLVFREAFNYPSEEELFSPNLSNKLAWAERIYDDIDNKDVYKNSINEAIDVLVDKAKIVERLDGGRLVPRTILRNVEEGKDIDKLFKNILKFSTEENNSAATILVSITAKPGITVDDLYRNIKLSLDIEKKSLQNIIAALANKGLLHIARSSFSKDSNTTKLFAFSHIPFIQSRSPNYANIEDTEANAVLKGMEPWILSSIKDFFQEQDEKQKLYNILNKLLKEKQVEFDDIEMEYGKTTSRKVGAWSYTLNPFIESDKNFSCIKISDTRLGRLILDILQYSLFTANDALGIYASVLSNIVSKDLNIIETIERDAVILKRDIMEKQMKRSN